MKYFLLISISLLFISSTSIAQDYTISNGQEFSPPKDSKWGGYAGETNTSMFLLRIKTKGKGTKYFIEGIDKKSLQKQFETELPLEEESDIPLDPAFTRIDAFCLVDKIAVSLSGYDRKEKLNKFFIKTINTDGTLGTLEEIASSPEKINIYNYVSTNKTKFLLINEQPWVDGKQNTSATLYDGKTLNKTWTKQLPDEFKNSKIESYYYNIDDNGNISFLSIK